MKLILSATNVGDVKKHGNKLNEIFLHFFNNLLIIIIFNYKMIRDNIMISTIISKK
jgi:hypothetical protein